jgi:cytidine deaminase
VDVSKSKAEALVLQDEEERDVEFGQRVRKTFPLADFFLEAGSEIKARQELQRFVELIFGNLRHTPAPDEQGMAMAHLASLRSASPARQVGAAITDSKGRVLSIGTNEVPRAGGGQYWQGDSDDGRDYAYDSIDTSDRMRKNLLGDLIDRIRKAGFLSGDCPPVDELLARNPENSSESIRESLIFDTIDFIRAVHAEASALLNLRIPLTEPGLTLYVTTFPCHEWARHIVISGIKRVMYVEPYPKSLVNELYHDSISVDEQCVGSRVIFLPFVGIAPNLYTRLFEVGERSRKNKYGIITKWQPHSSFPQLLDLYSEDAVRIAENKKLESFRQLLIEKGYS